MTVETLEGRDLLATLVVGPGQPFATITQAITAANPNDTIQVQAGTYTEQLTINKSLIFQGAGAGTTTIQAPNPMTPGVAGTYAVVTINNATPIQVTMSGFSIRGPGTLTGMTPQFGILVLGGATLNLSNSSVSNVRDTPLSGVQSGNAIQVGSNGLAQTGHVTLNLVTVSNYQKNGLTVTQPGSTATVTNSTFTGAGPTNSIAQNGIEIQNGAVATLTGNTVQGNNYTFSTSEFASGILINEAGSGSVLTNNVVKNNGLGIFTASQGTTSLNGNLITGNIYGLDATQGTTLSQGDVFQGNTVGVLAEVLSGATGNTVVNLNGATITGNGTGVQVLDATGPGGPVPVLNLSGLVFGNGTNFDNQTPQPILFNGQVFTSTPPPTGYATGSNQALVAAWYLDFLGRRVDPAGLAYFAGALDQGASPQRVAGEIYYSQEARVYRLNILYQTYLGRPADAGGIGYYTPQMGPGTDDRSIMIQVVTSAEYLGYHPLQAPYVQSLYQRILGRDAGADGLAYWVGALQQGQSPTDVARGLLYSPEFGNRLVSIDYQVLLFRQADSGGLAYYSSALTSGAMTPAGVVLALATSPEYRNTRAIA